MEKKIKETSKNRKEEDKKFICPTCGYSIEKENNYCRNCGEKIEENYFEFTDEEDKILDNKNEEYDDNFNEEHILSKKRKNNFKLNVDKIRNNKNLIVIISSVIVLLVCIIFTITYCNYFVNANSTTETVTKDVTITDTGIAESVSKVYDSVVVVETYVKGELYATGTGFVYKIDDKYGYILTNNHVIEEGTEIKVVFTEKQKKQ